ncbi:MAG: DUF4214 domain-containing protein [Lachnospiraceae bacterium]|nr:DUF4214 domain-containing protein [Lachnospiraceae bacterium]
MKKISLLLSAVIIAASVITAPAAVYAEENTEETVVETPAPDEEDEVPEEDPEFAGETDVISEDEDQGETDPADAAEEDAEADPSDEDADVPAGDDAGEAEDPEPAADPEIPEGSEAEDIPEATDEADAPEETEAITEEPDIVIAEEPEDGGIITVIGEDVTAEEPALETVKEESKASAEEEVTATETEEEEPDGCEIFVERCYKVILGRNPSKSELTKKADRLRNGTETATSILRGFFHSSEFSNKNIKDADYIKRLYKAALNREADATGIANRTQELEYGFTRDYVLKKITGSSEFKNKCSALGIEPGTLKLTDTLDLNPKTAIYVYNLYKTILGRKPDRASQVKKTAQAASDGVKAIIPGFFRSSEYTNKKKSDTDFIKDAYKACLNRNADSTGIKNRTADIDKGMSRMYVLKVILNSSEFSKKAKAAGVKEGTFPSGVLQFSDSYAGLTEYVVKTYRGGLNRKPNASEINKRVQYLLDEDLYAVDYLHSIAFSSEFGRKHETNEEIVTGMYELLLLRKPSSSEIESASERLEESGKENLFEHIIGSTECENKLDKYGLTADEGFSRRYLIRYLKSMEDSDYYLGTPYTGTWGPNSMYSTVPHGERWANGYEALNCSGFVASVMKNCGVNLNKIISVTGLPIANAYSWVRYAKAVCPQAVYSYVDKATMLAADRADNTVIEKCDILFMDPKEWGEGADCHVGIYYGSSPGEDRFWHQPHSGNCISAIRLPWPDCTMYVIKTDIWAKYVR